MDLGRVVHRRCAVELACVDRHVEHARRTATRCLIASWCVVGAVDLHFERTIRVVHLPVDDGADRSRVDRSPEFNPPERGLIVDVRCYLDMNWCRRNSWLVGLCWLCSVCAYARVGTRWRCWPCSWLVIICSRSSGAVPVHEVTPIVVGVGQCPRALDQRAVGVGVGHRSRNGNGSGLRRNSWGGESADPEQHGRSGCGHSANLVG